MTDYTQLREAVESDPNREQVEKEFGITFSKSDDRAVVNTAIKSLMRRFLAHPEFDLRYYETSGDKASYRVVDAEEFEEEGHDGRKPVWSVSGTIPIGTLKIRMNPRQHGSYSDVITNSVLDDGG